MQDYFSQMLIDAEDATTIALATALYEDAGDQGRAVRWEVNQAAHGDLLAHMFDQSEPVALIFSIPISVKYDWPNDRPLLRLISRDT